MSATRPVRMTADEFLAWAMQRPEGQRYELVAGEVVGMAPEPAAHARWKHRVCAALTHLAELECEEFPDGIATRIIRAGPIRLDPPGIELSGLF